ncbi:MAG: transcription antitermination factor NusB [Christensenellaceae bacterium]|jgi:N utilization substance protein B|nr:transcription antitermination factor NusB [Christensenellaceae bacterium]
MLSRKKARDAVYKLIYEFLFLKRPNDRTLSIFTSVDMLQSECDFIKTTYQGIIEHYSEIIDILKARVSNFSIDRVYKLDLAALIIGTYEMLYVVDIPHSVSINEAVELVKLYSTEKSGVFVNGVLAAVHKGLLNTIETSAVVSQSTDQ